MDVTIYYTPAYTKAPEAIERVTTPLESSWEHRRCCWRQSQNQPDTWYLSLEKYYKEKGENQKTWHQVYKLLVLSGCEDRAAYVEWLCENVEFVEVDGRVFWQNPSLNDGESDG